MSEEKHEILAAACRDSFDAFAQRAFTIIEPGVPYEWNWHIECVCAHMEAVYRGELPKLIINLPFRSLKSFLVSVAFPAWVLGKDPTQKFIVATYGSDLAKDLSQKCRDIVKSDWYQYVFPKTRVNPNQDEKMDWHTTQHGYYYATGMSGTVTGKGATYLLLDDALKPDEAYSETIRASTIKLIRNTLFSRFNDPRNGKFIMIQQRLHEGDPTGELLKDGGYHLLKLPGEAKTDHSITLGDQVWTMKPGDLLFPERLTRVVLDRFRLDMTELNYQAQIMQEPIPIGGGEFKHEWYQFYDPRTIKPKTMNVYIMVDAAAGDESNRKKKKASDFTAMVVVGLGTDNNYYLLDIVRDRLNPTERIDTLFILHRKWNDLCGRPPKVGYEKYGLMTDQHYALKRMAEENYRFPLTELGGTMGKDDRIRRMIPDLQKSRWYFPDHLVYHDNEGRPFDLVKELMESELTSFPNSRFDDMADALTRIYDDKMQATFPRQVKKPGYTAERREEPGAWISW